MQDLLSWLEHDHRAMLQLTRWLAHCDPSRSDSACHSVLSCAQRYIDAHLCIEDEILFPALEQKEKHDELRLLRSTHGLIRHAIGKISGALINADWPRFQTEASQLWQDLTHLDAYEQDRLHGLMKEQLSDAEMSQLLQACLVIRKRAGMLPPAPLPCCSKSERSAVEPNCPISCI